MWDELKHILRSAHDKAIIVEDGKPRYVVMSIEEYGRLQEQPEQPREAEGERSYEEANDELSSIEVDEGAKSEARGAIDLNDLPL